jgi:cytidine deaminase
MTRDIEKELTHQAKQASQNAYAPYSKFSVGCAVLTRDLQIFTGCNVENISFGLTICAERSAVFSAVNECGPDVKIDKIVIYTPTEHPITPCGACRQVLHEFSNDLQILCICNSERKKALKLEEILPDSPDIQFGK